MGYVLLDVPEVIDVCSLYAGGCGGWALFTRVIGAAGAGGAGRDAMPGTLYAGGCGKGTLEVAGGDALCLPEVLEVLEAVEGGLSFGVSKFLLWQFFRH